MTLSGESSAGIATTVIPFDTSPASTMQSQVSEDTINNAVNQALSQAGILEDRRKQEQQESVFEPISYSPTIVRKKSTPASNSRGLYTLETDGAVIKCTGGAKVSVKEAGIIAIKSGEALIVTTKSVQHIAVGYWQIQITPYAAIVVSFEDGILKVTNLYDTGASSVKVITTGGPIAIGAGEEVIIAADDKTISGTMQQDRLGRRNTKSHILPSTRCLAHSEISLVSLLENNTTVNQLARSCDPDDRNLSNRVLKMAACLMMATVKHGPYQTKRSN